MFGVQGLLVNMSFYVTFHIYKCAFDIFTTLVKLKCDKACGQEVGIKIYEKNSWITINIVEKSFWKISSRFSKIQVFWYTFVQNLFQGKKNCPK